MRDKSVKWGKQFVPRLYTKFEITQNSHPRKVTRWMRRGDARIDPAKLAKAAARHVHPRHKRQATQ